MSATRRRIVIIDDDDAVRRLLRTTLSEDEYDIVEATNGEEGLRIATEEPPALVLLDWQMPGRHGSLVLDELKRVRPMLPVIVLTTDNRRSQRELAEGLGANAFLSKPFNPLELFAVMERLLREPPLNETA